MANSDALALSIYCAELDLMSAGPVVEQLRTAIEKDGRCDVVIDMAPVRFIDSAAIGSLAELRKLLVGRGGTVTLRRVDRRVLKVLDILGLVEDFGITA